MEKDRSGKVIAIVGLIIGVVALSVGFAAFTQNLTINSSAQVTPGNLPLNVEFTSSSPKATEPVLTVTPTASANATGTNASIAETSGAYTTINNLSATFTAKGQSVTYDFFVHNASEYIAYLRSVTFNNASGGSTYKLCTPASGTTATTVNNTEGGAACDDISLSVKVGDETYTGSDSTMSGESISVDGYIPVKVTIAYDGSHPLPDGDFSVTFGSVTLGYSSVDKQS